MIYQHEVVSFILGAVDQLVEMMHIVDRTVWHMNPKLRTWKAMQIQPHFAHSILTDDIESINTQVHSIRVRIYLFWWNWHYETSEFVQLLQFK